ncbi:MAG: ATP-binding protein [Thermoanaerobaculum sp.]
MEKIWRWPFPFLVATAFQVVILALAAAGYGLGARYVEFSLRRGVEHAAAVAVADWQKHLELVAPAIPAGTPSQTAHLLPLPSLDHTHLRPGPVELEEAGLPVPGGGEDLRLRWGKEFASGLSGVVAVRFRPACRNCHGGFSPGEVMGALEFRVETAFLTKLLAVRKLNLAALVAGAAGLASAFLWVVAAVVVRRLRRAEEARAQTEAALRASEERYRTLVEHSLVGVYMVAENRIVYCNSRAAEMFGYSVDEVIGRNVADVIAPEDRALVAEQLGKRFAGEVRALRYSFSGLKKDGTRFPVEVFSARVDLPTGPAVLGMIVDNSEKEQARRAVEAAWRAVVGLPGQEPFAAAASSLAALLDVPVVFVTELVDDTLVVLGRHGPVKGDALPLSATPCEEVVRLRGPVAIPAGFRHKFNAASFAELVPEAYYGFPLVASNGRVLGVLAILTGQPRVFTEVEQHIVEIHAVRLARELERVHLERRQKALEEQLALSQKLASLGLLAGGIAHDFNNVLAGIAGEAELCARECPDPGARKRAQEILTLAERGGEVVKRILAFARPGIPRRQPVAVAQLLEETADLARHTLGPAFQVEVQSEEGLWVEGEAGELQQALMNLLVNARDAMPSGGTVWLRARGQGDRVVLEVEDQGVGIPEEILGRVFDPFFTTKAPGQGTGLGLTQVYRTVESHGGEVGMTSQVGRGTTVRIVLPRGRPGVAAPKEESVQGSLAGKRILVVDDELVVLETLAQLLAAEGVEVVPASSGVEALERVGEGPLDAAILDVLMPGMSGTELARLLLARFSDLCLVFSSGHASESLDDALLLRSRTAFLRKPYRFEELVGTLQRLLSAS